MIPTSELNTSFTSHAPGYWPDSAMETWSDQKWQLRNRIDSLADLESRINLTDEERAGVLLAGTKLAMSITPHFFNLIDKDDPDCPIRRQVIPRIEEGWTAPEELADPCGEDSHMPVPGLVHRYPDRVLFLVTDRCASYCRYCTRSRVSQVSASNSSKPIGSSLQIPRRNIPKSAMSCSPVAIPSSSPTRNSTDPHPPPCHLAHPVPPHRIAHSHFPPAKDHPGTLRNAKEAPPAFHFHPLKSSQGTHHRSSRWPRPPRRSRHPAREPVSPPARRERFPEIQKALAHKLLMCRVRPYYLYQCVLITGSSTSAPPSRRCRYHRETARPHHRLRRPPICHRRPGRWRENSGQPELRRRFRQLPRSPFATSRARYSTTRTPPRSPQRNASPSRKKLSAPKESGHSCPDNPPPRCKVSSLPFPISSGKSNSPP